MQNNEAHDCNKSRSLQIDAGWKECSVLQIILQQRPTITPKYTSGYDVADRHRAVDLTAHQSDGQDKLGSLVDGQRATIAIEMRMPQ